MSVAEPAVDGTAEDLGTEPETPPRAELVVVARPTTALVAGATAKERLDVATEIATQLDSVIKQQGLRTRIGKRKKVRPDGSERWEDAYHVDVEGWQTLAAFLELAVIPVWTRRVIDPATGEAERVTYTVRREVYVKGTRKADIQDGTATVERVETAEVDGYSWEARVEVFKDGALVSAGEAMCSRTEETWRTRDEHSVRSMAQTRATGKAIAGVARWIVTLAGYAGTPDEEMPSDGATVDGDVERHGATVDGDVERHAKLPAASEKLRDTTFNAVAWLLDGDVAATDETLTAIRAHFNGELPAPACQAILLAVVAAKRYRSAVA